MLNAFKTDKALDYNLYHRENIWNKEI